MVAACPVREGTGCRCRSFPESFSVRCRRAVDYSTHVCRYWREPTILTPRNWTLISSQTKGLGVLSLRRAKIAPLELGLQMDQVMEEPGSSELINSRIQNAI